MRVVWVVGAGPPTKEALAKAMSVERMGVDYLVRWASHPSEIPEAHRHHKSVVALVDAFHPKLPGFEGVKALRGMGFLGPIFLMGEPAPESSVSAFTDLTLTGYFPPPERMDYHQAAGLIHTQFYFDGRLDLSSYLAPGGRNAQETISSLKDFNAFGAKLATFVGKFGIDLAQLRKVLMGLSLPHVRQSPEGAKVDQPFSIYYGMDPSKVILAMPSFSKGISNASVRGEFSQALMQIKSPAPPNSLLPELHFSLRAAENLCVIGGTAKVESASMDPMMVMVTLQFPSKKTKIGVTTYMMFAEVRPTEEMSKEEASVTDIQAVTVPPVQSVTAAPTTSKSAPVISVQGDTKLLEKSEISKLLDDSPKVVGDSPASGGAATSSQNTSKPTTSGINPVEMLAAGAPKTSVSATPVPAPSVSSSAMSAEAEKELQHLREVCKSMGQDLRRLMKERREPTTDRELRDSLAQIQEKLTKVLAEKNQITSELDKLKEEAQKWVQEKAQLMKELEASSAELKTRAGEIESLKKDKKAA